MFCYTYIPCPVLLLFHPSLLLARRLPCQISDAVLLYPCMLHDPPISSFIVWSPKYLIFSEQNKSQSFSFCNFPHSPITQCISENKFLNTHSTLPLHYIPINCNVMLLWLSCLGLSWVMTLPAQWRWHCLSSGDDTACPVVIKVTPPSQSSDVYITTDVIVTLL
jgi:hypothetical protein